MDKKDPEAERKETGSEAGQLGETGSEEMQISENANESVVSGTGLDSVYMIVSIEPAEERIRLYSYANGLEYQYFFGLNTEFLDKYGKHSSVAKFSSGDAVRIGEMNYAGKLSQVQMSDVVWTQEKIRRFSLDEERRVFTIGDTKYSYDEKMFLFSNGEMIDWSSISKEDQLYAVGYGKKLLSVNVTTGHGTLALRNTELFEGSFLQLDNKVFAEITTDYAMDIPEGTYTLSVANNGWGGTQEITILRGETTEVDLDAIKGEGPKYGSILFVIDAVGAELYIDSQRYDYMEPISLQYGKHTLAIKADGYQDWIRYLYVNSSEATIVIDLMTKEQAAAVQASQNTASETSESEEEESESEWTEDMLTDYLSTLTELLDTLGT